MVVRRARTGLSIRTDSTTRLAVMAAARRAGRDLDGLVPCADSQFLQERKVAVPPVGSERVLGWGRHDPSLGHPPIATPSPEMKVGGDGVVEAAADHPCKYRHTAGHAPASKTKIPDGAGSPSRGSRVTATLGYSRRPTPTNRFTGWSAAVNVPPDIGVESLMNHNS